MTKSLSQSISIQQTSDQSKSKSKSKSTSLTSSLTEMERDLSSSGDGVHESPDHDTEGPQILYFFSVGLCLGAVTSFLLTKFKSNVPYSVVMFAEGMIAAVIFMHLDKFVDDTYPPLENIFDSIEDWGQINPVFLLYMFIPVLTFSDALKLPWVELSHIYQQSSLLALSSSAMVVCILGALMRVLVPHWSIVLCFLFSSSLSANDPVSIVPVMHSAGASHSLTILILSESLMTEGFATICFHLFGERVMDCHSTYSTLNLIGLLIKDFFLSPFIGAVVGFLTCTFMELVNQPYREMDTIVQITLQVFCAYFSFYLAEFEYEVSGVFSVVAAGVIFATFTKKTVLNHSFLENIWKILEWLASTLLFLFSGVAMVYSGFHRVSWKSDVLVVLVISIIMVGIRILSVLVVSPFLLRQHSTVPEVLFLSITGIKGAISIILILGIIEYYNVGYISKSDMQEFLIFGCGGIALNQLCTGTWTFYTLSYLNLLPTESSEELIILRFFRNKIRRELYEWNESTANTLTDSMLHISVLKTLGTIDIFTKESAEVEQLREDIAYLSHPGRPFSFELYRVLKIKFLESIYSLYLHDISIGRLVRNSHPAQRLLNSIDWIRNDHSATTITDWDILKDSICLNPYLFAFLERCMDPIFSLFSTFRPSLYYSRIVEKWKVYILTSYISAHRRTRIRMEHYLILDSVVKITTSIPEIQLLLQQSETLTKIAEDNLDHCPPRNVLEISNRQTANSLLHLQATMITKLREEGLLSEKDALNELEIIMKNGNEINRDSRIMRLTGVEHPMKHPMMNDDPTVRISLLDPRDSVQPVHGHTLDWDSSRRILPRSSHGRLRDLVSSNLLDMHPSVLPRPSLIQYAVSMEQNQSERKSYVAQFPSSRRSGQNYPPRLTDFDGDLNAAM